MSGTKAGGMKAAATNKAKYGKEFYARIGKKVAKMVTPAVLPLTLHQHVLLALRVAASLVVAQLKKLPKYRISDNDIVHLASEIALARKKGNAIFCAANPCKYPIHLG